MFEAAVGTALSVIFLFMWVGFWRIARFGAIVDIVSFVGLTWMFHGTYAGMMTGVLSALLVSLFLRGLRKLYVARKQQDVPTHPNMWARMKGRE